MHRHALRRALVAFRALHVQAEALSDFYLFIDLPVMRAEHTLDDAAQICDAKNVFAHHVPKDIMLVERERTLEQFLDIVIYLPTIVLRAFLFHDVV